MKQSQTVTNDNNTIETPQGNQGQFYTVTITRVSAADGTQKRITNKTFRLKDLPAVLQAVHQADEQSIALA